jgi:hypothetical protein
MRLLLILMAALGAGLLISMAEQVQRPLARLLRMALLGLATMLAIGGLALGVTGIADEMWWAAIIGGALLVVALRLAWKLRRRRRPNASPPGHVPLTNAAPDPHWRQLEPHLDWVSRQQARKARSAIEGFLAERESPSLSPDHRSLMISCEKRVPELIDACLDRCRNAKGDERRRYIDSTLDTLVEIGAEAERARREVREADDRRLHVLHRYFDGVAGSKDQPAKRP